MFVGTPFCPHCGGATMRPEDIEVPTVACPDCRVAMKQTRVGQTVLHECAKCFGIWVDAESFRRICAESERQADILGASKSTSAVTPATSATQKKLFRYRNCPKCGRLMNRYNFANASRVVIDSCKGDGVWFDRDELRQIVEFIRSGGLQLKGEREREHDAEKRRWQSMQRKADRDDDGWASNTNPSPSGFIILP
jgi:Zn-finger nucleic acid-binding protein